MPSSAWQTGRVRDFRGGETQAELPEEVGQNQLLRMENAMLFPTGWLTAAHQVDKEMVVGASLGMAIVPFANGTYNIFSAPGNGQVHGQLLDTSATNSVDMGGGSIHAIAGARIVGVHKSVHFLGKDYCPNPDDDDTKDGILNLTDFTLINIPGDPARAAKLRLYVNRLWLIYSDGTIRFSDNGNADSWSALNVTLLPNSEPLIDFFPVQGGAIAYGADAIYAMYGSNYTDLTFVALISSSTENPKHFTSGAIETGGVVYILSTEGVYRVTLNGAQLIPHHQENFLKSCFSFLSDPVKMISAVYLTRFQAIIFTWPEVYGVSQSLVFYIAGAYSKINKLLPTAFPFIIGMNDGNTDYLMGIAPGIFAKSEYPSSDMLAPQPSIVQTRHEDCTSYREKVWSCFVLVTGETVYGVTVQAILDYIGKPILIADNVACVAGENFFWLDDLPRSKQISVVITINNSGPLLTIVSDDDDAMVLTDETGNELVATINPGNWTIKELRLRYREAGPAL